MLEDPASSSFASSCVANASCSPHDLQLGMANQHVGGMQDFQTSGISINRQQMNGLGNQQNWQPNGFMQHVSASYESPPNGTQFWPSGPLDLDHQHQHYLHHHHREEQLYQSSSSGNMCHALRAARNHQRQQAQMAMSILENDMTTRQIVEPYFNYAINKGPPAMPVNYNAMQTIPSPEMSYPVRQTSVPLSSGTSSSTSSPPFAPETYQGASLPGDAPMTRPVANRSPYEWIKKTQYQPNSGKTRTKDKYRVVYTDQQRLHLEREFVMESQYITIRRKGELAKLLGLSPRQIKIWFQNRRAKQRKQYKKQEEELRRKDLYGAKQEL